MKNEYQEIESKMQKSIGFFKEDLTTIRAGRANPAILDKVSVGYYGAPTPIIQMANVSVPEARTLMIQPWDTSMTKEIEKALLASDIGITPNSDGKIIRLNFPPLTEERRKELTKLVHKKGEESKVAIRAIRRDALDQYKAMKKKSEITEDDLKETEKDIQVLTDKYVSKTDDIVAAKQEEIMEV